MIPGIVAAQATGVAGDTDPFWANVVSLMHFDGADGSTTFTDETGKTWTAIGNAQIDTAQSVFGGASGYFDGAGDGLTGPNTTDFDFGTGDFTVEGFFRLANLTGIQQVFTGSQDGYLSIFFNAGVPSLGRRNIAVDLAGSSGVSATTWTHVAWSRASGTLRIFVGGTQVASAANSTNYATSGASTLLGTGTTGNFPFNGHVEEFRMTKGVGRYTTGFTPPSAPFPNS